MSNVVESRELKCNAALGEIGDFSRETLSLCLNSVSRALLREILPARRARHLREASRIPQTIDRIVSLGANSSQFTDTWHAPRTLRGGQDQLCLLLWPHAANTFDSSTLTQRRKCSPGREQRRPSGIARRAAIRE